MELFFEFYINFYSSIHRPPIRSIVWGDRMELAAADRPQPARIEILLLRLNITDHRQRPVDREFPVVPELFIMNWHIVRMTLNTEDFVTGTDNLNNLVQNRENPRFYIVLAGIA